MALSYGLNITKKAPSDSHPVQVKRKTIFDDDSGPEDGPDDEDNPESIDTIGGLSSASEPQSRKAKNDTPIHSSGRPSKLPNISQYGDLSAHHSSSKHAKSAKTLDPSIYDYDSVYDSLHSKPSSSSVTADQEKRPKYMSNLLEAAEVRKRDQLRAKEKMLAKEREAEGDEFADKEKFVTAAYKRQQEEMRRLEEEEAVKEKEAEERKRREGGGLKGLYKNLLKQREQKHAAVLEAVEEWKTKGPEHSLLEKEEKVEINEVDIAKEKGAIINEDGQVVDKRQLLNAGLNPGTMPKKSSNAAQSATAGLRTYRRGINRDGSFIETAEEREAREHHAAVLKALEDYKTKGLKCSYLKEVKVETDEVDIAKGKPTIIGKDGQVADKMELLNAGLNPGTMPKKSPNATQSATAGLRGTSERSTVDNGSGRNESERERETRLFEEQLLGKRGLPGEEDEEADGEAVRSAKSRKLKDEILGLGR